MALLRWRHLVFYIYIMLISVLWLLAGLVLIIAGASMLTDGASAVAKRMGISDLVVGLTVVAFGTSAPELVISVVSAINGNAPLAVGNVVGSNIFNVFAIIGITAAIKPIKVEKSVLVNDLPFVVLTALLLLAMGNGPLLDGAHEAILNRVDGIVLLLVFAVFMRYTFAEAKKGDSSDPSARNVASKKPMGWLKAVAWIVLGLAGLVYGGDRFVDGASGIARQLGVSDAVIGLTIVAIGTSLPELATSITAALKGSPDMAIGNVIGSNIFNILFVLGTASAISPLAFGSIGNFDLLTMTVACIMFWLFARFYKDKTVTSSEGIILVLCYVAYTWKLIAEL